MTFANNRYVLGLVLLSSAAVSAHAQAYRTWVSGVGDDANPCSRTAPCKTFAGAISKTQAGGEISALDPSGFGVITINKSLTLNGAGTLTGIASNGANGIIVNAGANDKIFIRNINVNGMGTGQNGIRYLNAGMVAIENCTLDGYTQNGIDFAPTAAGMLLVKNTTITGGATGVRISGTTGRVTATLSNVAVRGASTGIESNYGFTEVTRSEITNNTNYGVLAQAGTISVDSSAVVGNGVAVQANSSGTVRISNNDFYENLTGFGCGSGTLASASNNRKAGNTGGSGGACIPNATITLQ